MSQTVHEVQRQKRPRSPETSQITKRYTTMRDTTPSAAPIVQPIDLVIDL